MNVLIFPPSKTARVEFDTECLLRQVPALRQVNKRHLTWDEFGERVARDFKTSPEIFRIVSDGQVSGDAPKSSAESSKWSRAKELVGGVFNLEDASYVALRKRLRLPNSSTPMQLLTLSLWLAGELGLSVTMTRPMVAVIFYAVAKSPAGWEILCSGAGSSPK